MSDLFDLNITSLISPYINSNNFPISFKIDNFYSYADPLSSVIFTMDPMFFKHISNSYKVNKFKKSKDYKTAKTLFEMSELKKKFDKLRKDRTMFFQFDMSKYFPLNNKVPNHNPNIYWSLYKYGRYIDARPTERINKSNSFYCCKYQIFDNLETNNFMLLWRDLEPLLISETFKLQLPYVSSDYLIKLLKPYLDLQYKFINIIDLKAEYFKHCLHLLKTDYNFRIAKKFKKSETKFFWNPGFESPRISFSLLINDAYLIAIFYGKPVSYSSELDSCMFIYSNINPAEDEELKKLKDDLAYVLNNEFILEVKKNSHQSGG
jgi:hypothetical protein